MQTGPPQQRTGPPQQRALNMHIPSIGEPSGAEDGSKMGPSGAKIAANTTSKTGISHGRGVKNEGFRNKWGTKETNLSAKITRSGDRSEEEEHRMESRMSEARN